MDDQVILSPAVPPKLRHLMDEPALVEAWQQQVAARQAEAVKITALLEYKKRLVTEYRHEPAALLCEVERLAVHHAALVLGVSDLTTTSILESASVARDFLPATWGAFQAGRIDMLRVRKITAATTEVDDDLLPRVDAPAAEQAAIRGIADFHHWLTRFIAQVDFDAYSALCASRRRGRYVRFTHNPDGTSYLEARLPTIEAAAIEKRLRITARRHHTAAAEGTTQDHNTQEHNTPTTNAGQSTRPEQVDGRTLAQREADLFSAWLRTGDTPEEGAAAVEAKIMIMIPQTTLTGASNEPGMAADRSWMLDADQARTLAANPDANHQWYQGTTGQKPGEADHDLLSATYVGRYPPQRLRDSLTFREGVCRATNCAVAAEHCDLDHQIPWDAGGETTATNLWALCRRHHRMKSHGLIHPPEATSRDGPEDTSPDSPEPRRLPTTDLIYAAHPITLAA